MLETGARPRRRPHGQPRWSSSLVGADELAEDGDELELLADQELPAADAHSSRSASAEGPLEG